MWCRVTNSYRGVINTSYVSWIQRVLYREVPLYVLFWTQFLVSIPTSFPFHSVSLPSPFLPFTSPPLQLCGKLKSCEKKGLHAHHPRDCLFYLRDFEVEELQDFLRQKKVEFDVNPPREQVKAAKKKVKRKKAGNVEAGDEGNQEDEEEG